MESQLHIIPQPTRTDRDTVVHSCILRRLGGEAAGDSEIWYQLPADVPRIDEGDAEPFLIATIFDAMIEDRRVVVHGKIGWELLSNIREFEMAWCRWRPRLSPVGIETLAGGEPSRRALPRDAAVAAFSGGVDAACTLYQHSRGLEGFRNRNILACVIVHGFDIDIANEAKFARSDELARETLAPLGIPLHPLRTNFRDVVHADWEDCHGAALVSCLQFLKGLAPSGLIGSSKPYDGLVLPYGSNPLTDPLLSSESFRIMHDGSRFDRTQKIAIVSEWPDACRNLRVCWRGSQVEANCGRCEKCIRTKLSFLALGKTPPASLGAPPSRKEILNLAFASHASQVDFQQILDDCDERGVDATWTRALRIRLRFHRWFLRFFHLRWLLLHILGRA